jgi:beta-lactam-binding protein with PASTA domain
MSAESARQKIEDTGLKVGVLKIQFSDRRQGSVLRQRPIGGALRPPGSTVYLVVAKPYPRIPSILLLSKASAITKLKAAGFKVAVTSRDSEREPGIVLDFHPTSHARPGDVITIVVAKASTPPNPCDPNYSGGCVPIATDVDCYGGGGNGPAYVSGPVYVKPGHYDIYGLDGNGNGVGCE